MAPEESISMVNYPDIYQTYMNTNIESFSLRFWISFPAEHVLRIYKAGLDAMQAEIDLIRSQGL